MFFFFFSLRNFHTIIDCLLTSNLHRSKKLEEKKMWKNVRYQIIKVRVTLIGKYFYNFFQELCRNQNRQKPREKIRMFPEKKRKRSAAVSSYIYVRSNGRRPDNEHRSLGPCECKGNLPEGLTSASWTNSRVFSYEGWIEKRKKKKVLEKFIQANGQSRRVSEPTEFSTFKNRSLFRAVAWLVRSSDCHTIRQPCTLI